VYVAAGLLARLVASFAIPSVVVFDDERTYLAMGDAVARSLAIGAHTEWVDNPWGNFTGRVFQLFGPSLYTMRPLNTLLGIVGALLMGRVIGRCRVTRGTVDRVVRWGLFLPPLVFVSSLMLKEQMIAFALVLTLFGFARRSLLGVLLSASGVALLLYFRVNLGLVVAPIVTLHYVARRFTPTPVGSIQRIGAWAMGAALVLGAGYLLSDLALVQNTTIVQIVKGTDLRGQQVMSDSRATYARYLDTGGGPSAVSVAAAPVLALYSPSPFRVITSSDPGVFVEALCFTILLYFAMPYFFLGAAECLESHERLMMLTLFLAVFVTASLSIFTYAPESFRFRWPALPLFFALAALGVTSRNRWRGWVVWGWWSTALTFGLVYLRAYQG
jgi:hypothetical protein